METYSVHFSFSQRFDFPASKVFDWCTDYTPSDLELMGENGRRRVERINDDTFILTDEYGTTDKSVLRTRVSAKVVRVYPEGLSWTNTRISPDGMYSQFLYQLVPEKGRSRLEYTGSQIFSGKRPGKRKLAAIAKRLTAEDSKSWRNLARAMASELSE
ncbi:MAG TPA: SRPBCC family protein [Nitrososphaerales archaeon]|nr:SRPBCC family protein [Nitrososphaerales archaeon]